MDEDNRKSVDEYIDRIISVLINIKSHSHEFTGEYKIEASLLDKLSEDADEIIQYLKYINSDAEFHKKSTEVLSLPKEEMRLFIKTYIRECKLKQIGEL